MKITKRNYYSQKANKEYMSYSQFKDFLKCPACAIAKINGEWETETTNAMLIGSYVDAWLDGEKELEKFKNDYPQIYTKKGELTNDFKMADHLCHVIADDEYLYKLLKGKRQIVLTGNIAGVPFKAKIDSLSKDYIVDGKVLKDTKDVWNLGEYEPFYKANRYDLQDVIYTTLHQQKTGKKLPYLLAIVTKEKYPSKELVMIDPNVEEMALNEIVTLAPQFQDMKDGKIEAWGCGECDYCKSIRKLTKEDIRRY